MTININYNTSNSAELRTLITLISNFLEIPKHCIDIEDTNDLLDKTDPNNIGFEYYVDGMRCTWVPDHMSNHECKIVPFAEWIRIQKFKRNSPFGMDQHSKNMQQIVNYLV